MDSIKRALGRDEVREIDRRAMKVVDAWLMKNHFKRHILHWSEDNE